MSVPFFDFRCEESVKLAIDRAFGRVQQSHSYILGKEVELFESELVSYLDRKDVYVVGTSSGTDAETLLLMVSNIKAGTAVISTPYTFFSTVSCIHRLGAEIIFCDIDRETCMLSPYKLEQLCQKLPKDADGNLMSYRGNRVKTVIPVHLFGTSFDFEKIRLICERYNLSLIEDAAQALGAEIPDLSVSKSSVSKAIKLGCLAPLAFLSFYPTKNLGAMGDAGAVIVQSEEIYHQIISLRNHGITDEAYRHDVIGGNFRMDAMQAAFLRAKLPFLDFWNQQRRNNAILYRQFLISNHLEDFLYLPTEPFASSGLLNHHTYHQFVIRIKKERLKIINRFKEKGIGYAIYYPIPLHLQHCFSCLGYKIGDFPMSEEIAQQSLALPIFPGITAHEIEEVVDVMSEILLQ